MSSRLLTQQDWRSRGRTGKFYLCRHIEYKSKLFESIPSDLEIFNIIVKDSINIVLIQIIGIIAVSW